MRIKSYRHLQAELERNMNETHHLMETRKNLEKALQETEGPMRVTSECIYHREGRKVINGTHRLNCCSLRLIKRTFSVPRLKRISLYWIQGIDLVNDNPENSLMREVDTIKSCQDKMRRTLEQVSIVLNRSNIIRKLIIIFDSDLTWNIKYSLFLSGEPSTRIKSQCSPSTRAWSCQQRWRHWNRSYMPPGIVRANTWFWYLPKYYKMSKYITEKCQ